MLAGEHSVAASIHGVVSRERRAIRTALDRLARDGLVEREPNRGAHVRLISLEEAVEMFEARAVLEGLALRYAARHATEQEIAELQTMLERMEQCFAILCRGLTQKQPACAVR